MAQWHLSSAYFQSRIFKAKKWWLVQVKNSLDGKAPRARKKCEPVSWQVLHSFEYHKNSKWVWRAYRHPVRLAAVPHTTPPSFWLTAEIEWQWPVEIKLRNTNAPEKVIIAKDDFFGGKKPQGRHPPPPFHMKKIIIIENTLHKITSRSQHN